MNNATIRIPLDAEVQGLDRPEKSRWEFEQTFDGFEFRQRGRFSLLGNLYLGLSALTWNSGLVGFGIAFLRPANFQPTAISTWGILAMLILFAWLGLNLLYAFFIVLTEPFRRTVWIFHRDSLETRTTRFGIGRTKIHSLENFSAMEIREDEEENEGNETPSLWELALVGNGDSEIFVFDTLNENEARWMADVILRVIEKPASAPLG